MDINSVLSTPISSYIRGASSGATGFVNVDPNGTTQISLSQTSGSFFVVEKILINEDHIIDLILELRDGKLDGINVTVPFKNAIIPFVDGLTPEADETKSVNTNFT